MQYFYFEGGDHAVTCLAQVHDEDEDVAECGSTSLTQRFLYLHAGDWQRARARAFGHTHAASAVRSAASSSSSSLSNRVIPLKPQHRPNARARARAPGAAVQTRLQS